MFFGLGLKVLRGTTATAYCENFVNYNVKSLITLTPWAFLPDFQWGSVTHQMAVPLQSISYCLFNHHNLFYQIQNALAFNRDMCCHLALCLQLLPFHWVSSWFTFKQWLLLVWDKKLSLIMHLCCHLVAKSCKTKLQLATLGITIKCNTQHTVSPCWALLCWVSNFLLLCWAPLFVIVLTVMLTVSFF